MKIQFLFVFSILWMIFLSGCERTPELQKVEGHAQGDELPYQLVERRSGGVGEGESCY
jgi:hypothetical protein